MLALIHNKRLKQIFEACAISLLSSVNTRPEFFNFQSLGKLVLNGYISNFNWFSLLTHLYLLEPNVSNLNLSSWTIRSYLFYFPFHLKKIFYHCFYHLLLYPLETQQISNISPRNNVIIFSKIRMLNILLWIVLFYIHFLFSYNFSNIPQISLTNHTFHESWNYNRNDQRQFS